MAINIPENIEQVTPIWLEQALVTSLPATSIQSVKTQRIGHGMMSDLYSATICYAEGEGPKSVAVKLPTANQQNREVAVTFDNYRREVEFYQHAAELTPMRTPEIYLAASSTPDKFILVMEDLSDWENGDQSIGCTVEYANAVMDTLADLHAAFWNKVDNGDYDWMPNSFPSIMSEGLAEGTAANYDNFTKVFGGLLTRELRDAKQAYIGRLPELQSWINAGPRTVIHGDFRLDNLFFKTGYHAVEVACCDWQGSVRGKGMHDVAYFLSGNIDTNLRREHEETLIRRWVDALEARGVAGYSHQQAIQDYRKAILVLWSYVVNNGGLRTEDQRDEDWVSAQVQRHAAAMVDHDCLALL